MIGLLVVNLRDDQYEAPPALWVHLRMKTRAAAGLCPRKVLGPWTETLARTEGLRMVDEWNQRRALTYGCF